MGNAGNITAYWKGYKEYREAGQSKRRPKMLGFQAEGSAPIVAGEPVLDPQTIATAIKIGNPASWKTAVAARDESGGLIETVTDEENGRYYRLIKTFGERTGVPLVLNTSFNVRGEPIVCTPENAYRCFMATNMDVLVMENFVLYKDRQPQAEQHEIDEYLAQFDLD